MFKKGQIESFGLVIIVLLIVFIGLFFLLFMRESSDDESIYLSAKAYNLANALYRADIGAVSFKDLASSCCLNNEGECEILKEFVNANLNLVEEDSGFILKCGNEESINVGNCFLGINSESFRGSEYEMSVIICRK